MLFYQLLVSDNSLIKMLQSFDQTSQRDRITISEGIYATKY